MMTSSTADCLTHPQTTTLRCFISTFVLKTSLVRLAMVKLLRSVVEVTVLMQGLLNSVGARATELPCLGHILRPEAAFSNAPPPSNALAAFLNTALELPLPRTLWSEVAISNAFPFGNASAAILNTALELPLPRTHFVARGCIPQHIPTVQRLTEIVNTAPELPLPWTPFVARGGIHQRIPIWQRLGSQSQSCCGGKSDFAMSQD